MGPWLVTTEDIPDPQALQISTYVNQERKQHCSTAQMIFPVAVIIEYLSAMVTWNRGMSSAPARWRRGSRQRAVPAAGGTRSG